MKGAPQGSQGFCSASGWIDSSIFLEWLKHFQFHTNSSTNFKVILILDNHCSHLSLPRIDYARDKGIIMLSIPPHSSHKLQPLDKTFFGAFKVYYNQEINKWLLNHPGKRVTDFDVADLAGNAYNRAATMEKAVNGFRSTGIFPFNPDVFSDDDFAPATVTELVTFEDDTDSGMIASANANGPVVPNASFASQLDVQTSTSSSRISEEPLVQASPSYSSISEEPDTCSGTTSSPFPRVFATDILPLPYTKITYRKRKSRRSEIITSSPYKKSVEKKSENAKTPVAKKCRKMLGRKSNKKRLTFDKEYKCIFCQQVYEHPPKEDWIECHKCKNWCHEKCSGYDKSGKYTCDFCD